MRGGQLWGPDEKGKGEERNEGMNEVDADRWDWIIVAKMGWGEMR